MSKKTKFLTFFKQFSKFAPLPLLNFGVDLKLNLHYAKFCVSNLFFQKLSKKNLWGVESTPPPPLLGTGRVNKRSLWYF